MRKLVGLALLFAVGGCHHRERPLYRGGDTGPAVVVVDALAPAAPPVPLTDEREPDDDLDHAQPLESGKGISGTIGAPKTVHRRPVGDVDFYSFIDASAPPSDGGLAFDEAHIQLSGVPGIDLALEALDGDGKRLWLANDAGAGQGETIPNLAVEPGHTYYLKVRALTPKAGGASYQLVVRTAPSTPGEEREPNDVVGAATALPAVGDASGFYGRRHDDDWVTVPVAVAAQGAILRLELTPVDGVAPSLEVLGPAPLAQARAGKGSELRLRDIGLPPGTSQVAIHLHALEGQNPDVRWTLRMSLEPPFTDGGAEREPNDTPATATPLSAGQSVNGFLWPGDVDVYRVSGVPAGMMVKASLDPLPGVDLKLERIAPDGKVLARADDHGAGQGEALPPWPGGEVLFRVSARARDTAFDTPYRLTVTADPGAPDLEREPNDGPASATTWPDAATTMRGFIAPRGDQDWFRFTAPAGKSRVTADVTGPMALRVRLSDLSRAPLGPATGPAHAEGPIVPGQSYFVTVRAESARASEPTSAYTVTLRFE